MGPTPPTRMQSLRQRRPAIVVVKRRWAPGYHAELGESVSASARRPFPCDAGLPDGVERVRSSLVPNCGHFAQNKVAKSYEFEPGHSPAEGGLAVQKSVHRRPARREGIPSFLYTGG